MKDQVPLKEWSIIEIFFNFFPMHSPFNNFIVRPQQKTESLKPGSLRFVVAVWGFLFGLLWFFLALLLLLLKTLMQIQIFFLGSEYVTPHYRISFGQEFEQYCYNNFSWYIFCCILCIRWSVTCVISNYRTHHQ